MELQWQLIKARAKDIFRQKAYLLKSVFSLWPPALSHLAGTLMYNTEGKFFGSCALLSFLNGYFYRNYRGRM